MTIGTTTPVMADDGNLLDIDSLPHTYGWTGADLTSDTVTVTDNNGATKTYVQTMTYAGGVIQTSSEWVKQ